MPDRALRRLTAEEWQTTPFVRPNASNARQGIKTKIEAAPCTRELARPNASNARQGIKTPISRLSLAYSPRSVRTPPMPDRALRPTRRRPPQRQRQGVRTPPMPDRALRRHRLCGFRRASVGVRTPPMPDRALRLKNCSDGEPFIAFRPNASNARQGIKTGLPWPSLSRGEQKSSERLQCPTGH